MVVFFKVFRESVRFDGGWFHLIGNMWFLAVFGDNIEDAMGWWRFILFYLLCGLAAAAMQVATDTRSVLPMVGASGAISGVMGAYAVLFPRAPVHVLVFFGFIFTRLVFPAFLMLGYWFFIQLLGGIPALAPIIVVVLSMECPVQKCRVMVLAYTGRSRNERQGVILEKIPFLISTFAAF